MNKWGQFAIGVISAGAIQFGLLAGTGATGMILIAGVVGAMGTAAASLLKQLPKREWSAEERSAKLNQQLNE